MTSGVAGTLNGCSEKMTSGFERGDIYIYMYIYIYIYIYTHTQLWLIRVAAQQKPIKQRKAIIF